VQPLSLNEIREKYLSFFEAKGHLRLPSFPLIPQNDKSLLLINAGMTPLKPYFTGQEVPPSKRATSCQKCVRTTDFEEVGKTARHNSFFQMLGNFSFADYFKPEAITWAWEFLTEVLEIPADLLYVTVYHEDDEAYDYWNKNIGLAPERIFRLGKEDNFWEHGVGPCGPSSEIFFDRGDRFSCDNPKCDVTCECGRYMEIWNLVFTQFNKTDKGEYEKLANFGIDTGMGLERISVAMQGVDSIFDIDTYSKLLGKIRELTGVTGKMDDAVATSVKIIADHIRSIVFLTADGVLPSNEGRGYVLRRLLRRAVRHAKLLGRNTPFIGQLCPIIIEENAGAYPELSERQAHILQVLTNEEDRFFATLDTGMALLEELCEALGSNKVFSGADAFKLYDTYGFPPELTQEMLEEKGLTYDEEGFKKEMESQRQRARAARGESNYMGAAETVFNQLDVGLSTEFVGYDKTAVEAKVLALAVENKLTNIANAGDSVAVFLDKTTFYSESGGQKGDTGVLALLSSGAGSNVGSGRIEITDCVKVVGGKIAHLGVVTEGSISVGSIVMAAVDGERRLATACNHTATHLLNRALRTVLGNHIEQAGSEVSGDRLRFDFTHFSGVGHEDLQAIEDAVNAYIFAGLSVAVSEMPMDDARKAGAVMLMGEKGEKYGSTVRVVNIGDGTSVELCGGTHIANTSQIGLFKLLSEGSVAAGVRRIEGVTGAAALAQYREAESQLNEAAAALKTTPDQLTNRIQALNTELRQAQQALERLKAKAAVGQASEILDKTESHGGFTWLATGLTGLDAAGLRTLGDQLKEKVDVLLLASATEGGPVQFMAHVSKGAVDAGIHAGNMVKEAATICGGNGGGRPNNAQAGGKDASKVNEALQAGMALAKQKIS